MENVITSGDDGVHDVPDDGCYTGAAVGTTIMEDLCKPSTHPQGCGMGACNCDLVDEVHKVLLTEEQCNHEIGRCSCTYIWRARPALVPRYENNESDKIGDKDDREDFAVVGEYDV